MFDERCCYSPVVCHSCSYFTPMISTFIKSFITVTYIISTSWCDYTFSHQRFTTWDPYTFYYITDTLSQSMILDAVSEGHVALEDHLPVPVKKGYLIFVFSIRYRMGDSFMWWKRRLLQFVETKRIILLCVHSSFLSFKCSRCSSEFVTLHHWI